MARIRSIKPEFWSSEQIIACSRDARLLFIGLWNYADDAGNIAVEPRTIKARIFMLDDDIRPETVLGMLEELSKNGLGVFYEVDGKRYFNITGWHHQRIDKPQKPKYPRMVVEYSKSDRGTLPPDRIGEDRRGKDRKEGKPLNRVFLPSINSEQVREQKEEATGNGHTMPPLSKPTRPELSEEEKLDAWFANSGINTIIDLTNMARLRAGKTMQTWRKQAGDELAKSIIERAKAEKVENPALWIENQIVIEKELLAGLVKHNETQENAQ